MVEDYKIEIGIRLKKLRKAKKMPIQDIADRIGVARPTYTNYEIGHRAPNGEKLVKLANVFDTTVDYITGKTDDPDQPDYSLLQDTLKKVSMDSYGKPLSDKQADDLSEIIMKLLKD